MDTLKLASLSFCSGNDKTANIQRAQKLIIAAAEQGADWILLPEIFSFHGSYEHLYINAEFEGGPTFQILANLASHHRVCIFAGTMGERPEESLPVAKRFNSQGQRRVYNTMYVFNREGKLAGKYRKTHLFSLLGHDATHTYCEPDGYIPGDTRTVITLEDWTVGLSVCYDLRFPEFFCAMGRSQPLDMIVLPAAFTYHTGKSHWELLLKARAVENQCFVFASNQCGEHRPGRKSWGHSMIIDPWGQKLASTGESSGIAFAEINKSDMNTIRSKLPALDNRRPELYL